MTWVGTHTELNWSTAGKRKDLDEVKTALDLGVPLAQVADEHFSAFIRYEKGFRSYQRLKSAKRDWPMELIVIVGPSGTGKSRWARTHYPDAFWKMKGTWWDGYDGQETVVVDEMYGHCFPYTFLLQLCDRYPMCVEVKGSVVNFISRRIVFTSNQHPRDWYSAEATHSGPWELSPLCRRLREFGRMYYTGEVHVARPAFFDVAAEGDVTYFLNGVGVD